MKIAVIGIVASCLVGCSSVDRVSNWAADLVPEKPVQTAEEKRMAVTPASFSWLDSYPSVGFW